MSRATGRPALDLSLANLVGETGAAPGLGFDIPNVDAEIQSTVTHTSVPGAMVPPEARDNYLVDLDLVHPFHNNPRRSENPLYESILWSIFYDGLLNRLCISKRPEDAHFVVLNGGNTRLQALRHIRDHYEEMLADHQARAAESGDDRAVKTPQPREMFSRVATRFVPWVSEIDAFEAHLAENEARSDLTWWDQACAKMKHRELLGEQLGAPLSINAYAKVVATRGKSGNSRESLLRCEFAVRHLGPIAAIAPSVVTNPLAQELRGEVLSLQSLWRTRFPEQPLSAFDAWLGNTVRAWVAERADRLAATPPQFNVHDLVQAINKAAQLALGGDPNEMWRWKMFHREAVEKKGFKNGEAHKLSWEDFCAASMPKPYQAPPRSAEEEAEFQHVQQERQEKWRQERAAQEAASKAEAAAFLQRSREALGKALPAAKLPEPVQDALRQLLDDTHPLLQFLADEDDSPAAGKRSKATDEAREALHQSVRQILNHFLRHY